MRIKIEIELRKVDGGKSQSDDSIAEALCEDIESIGSIWPQDENHDDSTEYEIESAVRVE